MALFGNQYWVPGATHIFIWLTLLFAIYKTLGWVTESSRVSASAAVFLVLVYAVSPYHFEQWCALLGEVPSILFVIFGFTLWAIDPYSKHRHNWSITAHWFRGDDKVVVTDLCGCIRSKRVRLEFFK